MNAWHALMLRARTSLIVLGGLLVLCLASLLGSRHWSTQQLAALARSENERSAQVAANITNRAELLYLQSHSAQFRQLGQLGLVGPADRQAWVQQLLASHQHAALPGPLQWTLHAPEPLAAGDATAPAQGSGAWVHELEFSLSGVHEEEVLALLQDFGAGVRGRMRVNACSFTQPTPEGLSAHCSLRFFTLDGPEAPPTAPTSRPAAAPAFKAALGPLLYSRQQRVAIAQARTATPEGSSRMQLSGIVRRERAKGTVWINRQAITVGQALPPARHTRLTPAGVAIDGQPLRVGETVDLRSHERSDLVAPGALRIRETP
jgi:hypothetical protein